MAAAATHPLPTGASAPVWFTLQVVPGGRREIRTPVGGYSPSHRFRGGPIGPLWHPSMCAVAAAIVGPAPAGTAAFALPLSFPAPQGDRGPHGSHVSGEGEIWAH